MPDFKYQKGSADVLLSFKDFSTSTSTTELNGAISASATTLILDDVSNFPDSGTVLIGSELITYTARDTSAQELQNATRGANSTTASAHENNKKVTNYTTVRIHQSNVTPTTTKIDTRGRARQANILISSENVNDKWRFGTLRLDVKPDGGR